MNNEFSSKQRDFCTTEYLRYCLKRGYSESQSRSMIDLFWQKVDEYPQYIESCYRYRKSKGLLPVYDESRHPDLDYASKASGISADFIWQLMGIFANNYQLEFEN